MHPSEGRRENIRRLMYLDEDFKDFFGLSYTGVSSSKIKKKNYCILHFQPPKRKHKTS
jgi:hypothetical protein